MTDSPTHVKWDSGVGVLCLLVLFVQRKTKSSQACLRSLPAYLSNALLTQSMLGSHARNVADLLPGLQVTRMILIQSPAPKGCLSCRADGQGLGDPSTAEWWRVKSSEVNLSLGGSERTFCFFTKKDAWTVSYWNNKAKAAWTRDVVSIAVNDLSHWWGKNLERFWADQLWLKVTWASRQKACLSRSSIWSPEWWAWDRRTGPLQGMFTTKGTQTHIHRRSS